MTEPESTDERLPAYVIEGARSSRSRCKSCRRSIDKGSLRIGFLIEGPFGTGYLWHHLRCAARRDFGRVEEAYRAEAWNAAKERPKDLPSLEELGRARDEALEKKMARRELPYVEVAPSGRSKCKQCGEIIEKDSLRVVLGRSVEFGRQVRTTPIHVHPRCVAPALAAEDSATETEGFVEALRANSDEPTGGFDGVIGEIGSIGL